MHVLIVNYSLNRRVTDPEILLDGQRLCVDYAAALTRAGAQVTLYRRFHLDHRLERQGAHYRFVRDRKAAGEDRHFSLRMNRMIAHQAGAIVGKGRACIVHIDGLLYPLQTALLRALLPRQVPVVVQHHAERPRKSIVGRALQCTALSDLDAYLFTARPLADAWLLAGVIPDAGRVYELMEVSSGLVCPPRDACRKSTGMYGDPSIFWAGNLYPNKAPMVVLRAFERFLHNFPKARLYMAYRSESLLAEVKRLIRQSPLLRSSVVLLGTLPYERIGAYYGSSDLFVQGSAYESGGVAPLDALACGVLPVITDIPPFRQITAQGRHGILWPVGDEDGLHQSLLAGMARVSDTCRRERADYFRTCMSYEAIARTAVEIYGHLISEKRTGA